VSALLGIGLASITLAGPTLAARPVSAALLSAGPSSAGLAPNVSAGPAQARVTSCSIGHPDSGLSAEVAASARTARTWRLYQAYFLRQPDPGGLDYWLGQSRAGLSLQAMAFNFERSTEFQLRYGSLDNGAFVNLVYANVMCRTPDSDGLAYWLNLLNQGAIGRGELMVLFSESAEFTNTTGTRWSSFADPAAATLADDGYDVQGIPGGLMVRVDFARVDFRASHERCSVASINGNWFFTPERPDPTPIGFAVIDGQQIPGSGERDDRGVLGERYRPNGPDSERIFTWDNFNQNSNLASKDGRVLENWSSWQPPGTPALDNAAEWRWAASGIPLIVNRQVWTGFQSIPTNDYTHYTTRHSFLAFDKVWGTLIFGATTAMTSAQLIAWAQSQGYDDLVKFDGGGSAELNINAQPRVAGTGRDVPLWLGIGC
jgi:Domain of unknown function (DUF4214)